MGTPIESGNPVQGELNTPGPNPAWNDVLGVIPAELHEQVTPFFQQWDQSAQQRIEQVNTKLKDFESFQPFVEHGIGADELERGLQLMYQLNTNPQQFYQALAETYNLGTPQGGNPNPQTPSLVEPGDNEFDLSNHPKYQELQRGLELVSQIVLQDQQAKQAATEDAKLEKELSDLKAKHGSFDEDYVLWLMDRGKSGEEAVAAYQALTNQNAPQKPFAPQILGASGGAGSGYPSQAVDPRKLNGQQTRDLVAQMLRATKFD